MAEYESVSGALPASSPHEEREAFDRLSASSDRLVRENDELRESLSARLDDIEHEQARVAELEAALRLIADGKHPEHRGILAAQIARHALKGKGAA